MKRLVIPIIILLLVVSCQKEVYYNVSTSVNPKDAGTVSVFPTSPSVLEGTSVTVTAQPKGEYVFTGWSGNLSGTDNPKTVAVTSDLNITANFALKEYPLSISVEGEGAVSEKVISTKTDYTSGTVVELTAKPADHWLFDHWEGDLNGTTNPVQITLSSAKTVKAVFVKKMYDLSIEIQGEGTVEEAVLQTKATSIQEGTVVELTAQPGDHWVFDHWEGDLSGNKNPAQITIASDKKVKAVFVEKMYPLTIEVEGSGAVKEEVISTKSGSYQEGSVIELTASPAEHWVFDHWEGDLAGSQNPSQITISSAKTVKAVFVEKMYPLTVEVQGGGAVKEELVGTKSNSYQEGSVVQLTAIPNTYWAFDHWEGDVTGNDNPALITISTASTVKAIFVEQDPGIVFTETDYISPYEINRRMGLGWCFGCQMDSFRIEDIVQADEECWGNPKCTQKLFDAAAKSGISSVRIQVCWLGQVGPAPDYLIDESWLDRVAEVVGYAEKAGMNVIINMQNDDRTNFWGDDDWTLLQLAHREEFWLDPERAAKDPEFKKTVNQRVRAMWTQIARKFRNKGDFLMFESMNEPGSTFFWSWASAEEKDAHQGEFDCLNQWNQTFVDAVRSTGGNNASRWLVVVGAAAKERHFDRLVIPTDYVSNNRIMVALHFYEPESYCQGETRQWGHTAYDLNEDALKFDEHYVAEAFKSYKTKYMDKGIPLCVNEIGAKNRDNEDDKRLHLYYLEYVTRAAALNNMAVFIYDQGGNGPHYTSFSIFDHATGAFLAYGEELMQTVYKAAISTDPNYDLDYIYNKVPRLYPQNPAEIPDPDFLAHLLKNYDFDTNGILTTDELVRVQALRVSEMGIHSLSGLQYFPNLTSLDCGRNYLRELDLHDNPRIEYLNCEHNSQLSSLDVSMLPNLKYLNAQDCSIGKIDVSNNPLLIQYQVNSNPFYSIPDLSHNPNLEQIHINTYAGAYYIAPDFFSSFPSLTGVSFGGYPLSHIDLSKNTRLESIWAHDMPNMEELDLSASPHLNYLYIPNSRRLKTIYVHPDLNLNSFTVVKDDDISVRIIPKH